MYAIYLTVLRIFFYYFNYVSLFHSLWHFKNIICVIHLFFLYHIDWIEYIAVNYFVWQWKGTKKKRHSSETADSSDWGTPEQ